MDLFWLLLSLKQANFDLKQNRAVLIPYFEVENETECLFLPSIPLKVRKRQVLESEKGSCKFFMVWINKR